MLDNSDTSKDSPTEKPARRRAAGRPAGPPAAPSTDIFAPPVAPEKTVSPEKTATTEAKNTEQKNTEQKNTLVDKPAQSADSNDKTTTSGAPSKKSDDAAETPVKKAPGRKPAAKKADSEDASPKDSGSGRAGEVTTDGDKADKRSNASATDANGLLFKAPDPSVAPARKKSAKNDSNEADSRDQGDDASNKNNGGKSTSNKNSGGKNTGNKSTGNKNTGNKNADNKNDLDKSSDNDSDSSGDRDDDEHFSEDGTPRRRRRSRGGRRRRKNENDGDENSSDSNDSNDDDGNGQSLRRRRRRRASDDGDNSSADDPDNTVVRVRENRSAEDEITGVSGSTRLEAKKQRRREGREAGRRRAPIVSEAEFLARRESVKREMIIRQHPEYTQIGVLEDDQLVEHYVARESQTSLIGNIYLGKVQNVLPSMEAAFIDIGKGRNAVLYAGEVDWSAHGGGKQRKIEDALTSGQSVLVQVTKDPVGQKGARLTSQVSLAGRFLVFVPGGQTSGISRKLPDTERSRLKGLLKDVLPDEVGVIVRTAAEGATEEQLSRDVSALTARWEDIESKIKAGNAPALLYAEPDLMIKVVRDLFNEDFNKLVVDGADAWDMISGYIAHVAPDLSDRLEQWNASGSDIFDSFRVDEQIAKALERKVFLPSGGSLVIDRTEAMTVVDVNTGKFTGTGGNLEETVTKNNLEAAEEIVRQLRLRDIGGIIVIDFIDMVLENNRDLVLRRLVECLGRDRTRHQVAEVTSLGLVQMTRKRIGTGLLESFSADCDHCNGRGVVVKPEPVEPKPQDDSHHGRGNRRGGRSHQSDNNKSDNNKSDGNKSDNSKSGKNKPENKSSDKQSDNGGEETNKSGKSKSATNKSEDKSGDSKMDKTGSEQASSTDSPGAKNDQQQSASENTESSDPSKPVKTSTDDKAKNTHEGNDSDADSSAKNPESKADVSEETAEKSQKDAPVLTSEGNAP